MSSYHQRQEVDAIIRDTIDKVLDFSCSALAALQIPLPPTWWRCMPLSLRSLSFWVFIVLEILKLSNSICLSTQLSKSPREVSKFASVALVDIDFDEIQVYVKYFDITFIPSTVFFFNAHHMKMDSGYVWTLFLLLFVYHVILAIELYVSKALSNIAKFEL